MTTHHVVIKGSFISTNFSERLFSSPNWDTPIKYSPEDQKDLFEPFHRGKNVRNISGTGLGLIVTKNVLIYTVEV